MQIHQKTRILLHCALFTALGVLLGGPLNIPGIMMGTYSFKIGLGVLPVILTGIVYGPLYGGIVGALVDLLQALLFSKGAYMPWFTVIGVLFGLIPGLFFIKNQPATFLRIVLAVACGQLIASVLCNTILLMVLYGQPFELIYVRLLNQAIMIPIYATLIYYLLPLLKRFGVGRVLSHNQS